MKFIANKLEDRAERKIERKAEAVAVAVGTAILLGENPDRFKIPIGIRPLGIRPQNYAAAVGSRVEKKLRLLEIYDIRYDAAATEEASLKIGPGLTTFDGEGRLLMTETFTHLPPQMKGLLTLVLVNTQE